MALIITSNYNISPPSTSSYLRKGINLRSLI
ncbi:hypothetical protein CBNA_1232 [Coxiella burnetii str. Namibia]|nr:hypothetical protein CBNA_1232 [Coxiella burnetii str. Namibia]